MASAKFADNPFLVGHDNPIFQPDSELGFLVHSGKFVGDTSFQTYEDIKPTLARDAFSSITVLNMGDSSTSGWQSDHIEQNTKIDPLSPYFQYKTYSDLMRERGLKVVNAGASGYSSHQGKKYLEQLLKKFAADKIFFNFVTLYFGNNDAVFSTIEDRVSIDNMTSSIDANYHRVTPTDFTENVTSMVSTIKKYGATPAIIVPVRNYDWQPGIRSEKHPEEFEKAITKLVDPLRKELVAAKKLFDSKKIEKAYEMDRFLPRIKKPYVNILRKIARQKNVALIDVQSKLSSKKNKEYFCDYCHPLEPINTLIVEDFLRITRSYSPRNTPKKSPENSSKNASKEIYPLW